MAEDVACIVPALNAASAVGGVLDGLRRALPGALLIGVDDGSSDGTAEILRGRCDQVAVHATNRGKGAALRTGFDAALSAGVAAVVTIDADGQHEATSAPALIARLADSDIVIGARTRDRGTMPFGRRLTNGMSAAAVSHCTGQHVPDSQSGFRAIRAEVVRTVRPTGDRYEFETAFLILAARAGYRIASVTVLMLLRPRGRSTRRSVGWPLATTPSPRSTPPARGAQRATAVGRSRRGATAVGRSRRVVGARLVGARSSLINHVRGAVKSSGARLPAW